MNDNKDNLVKCFYLKDDKCTVDPLSYLEFCQNCPNRGRFARLSFNES